MIDEMEAAADELDTAPGVPLIVRHQQEFGDEPEDWEEEWFMAPATLLDKRDSWTGDLDRLSRGLACPPRRRPRRTLPWPGIKGV